MAVFSDRLKETRKLRGITQKQMADFLEITEQAYQNYEYGKREPNHETTLKIADYFNVPTDYLFGRSKFLRTEDGHWYVKLPPDLFGTTDEQMAEMERKAKEKWEKSNKIRKKK
jgi:transcriptional regulator with XRE-family HTH domain